MGYRAVLSSNITTDTLLLRLYSISSGQPHLPLEDQVPPDYKVPWIFFSGDRDWMESLTGNIGPKKVIEKTENGSCIEYIADSGHIIFMDNPTALTAAILKHKRIFEGKVSPVTASPKSQNLA